MDFIGSFKEIMAMSKDKLDETMATPRARRLKAQAELERAELESEIADTKGKMSEMLADKEGHKNFSFKPLFALADKLAILERKEKQYVKLLKQLFPEDYKKA